jgi:hypothetical protein
MEEAEERQRDCQCSEQYGKNEAGIDVTFRHGRLVVVCTRIASEPAPVGQEKAAQSY